MATTSNIKVVCRCAELILLSFNLSKRARSFRPINAIEQREGGEVVVDFDDGMSTVKMRSTTAGSGPEKDGFTFDKVFPMETQQHEVFDYGVKELVFILRRVL